MAGGCSVVSQRLADCANPVGEEQSVRRSATLCLTRARGSADSDNGIGHVAGLRAAVPHMPTLADQRLLVTHDGFAARPFAGRCRQRSTTAAVCPCSCTRSDRLAPGPPASQPALAGRLGLVLPPSSRVLSPWPRALAKKTRHLQHSACGNQSPRFSDRRDLRSRPRACRFQHAVTTSSAEKNVPSTSWLAAFGSSSGTVDVTVLAVTDRVGTPS